MLIKNEIISVLHDLSKQYHRTKTALKYASSFQLLVSTILSAQSTDNQVNKITRNLFKDYPDAHAFIKLTPDELENRIKSIGLYRSKARHILATTYELVKKYNGEVPMSREELMKLPGVGRKTANVVLSIASDFPAIAVDTHVFRVANRIGLADAKTVRATEEQLMQNIPKTDWSDAHHWLIWHGRKICKARNPVCDTCFISQYCAYARNNK